jgi:hypothetical protein
MRRAMTEPARTGGVDDPHMALRRQVETLAQRFPDVERPELEELVQSTYDKLAQQAAVDAHLVAMTENQVTEHLRARGETVHVRGEDAD